MQKTRIFKAKKFSAQFSNIASDKSISHRCAMFALLSDGVCEISNYLGADDTLDTLNIAQSLGLGVEKMGQNAYKFSAPKQIIEPKDILYCGNAGTAMRLYTGLLAGVSGYFVLNGDKYLNARPMKRVIEPLSNIGARIFARDNGNFAPITIMGGSVAAFDFKSPISSAQVKSALILAALHASDECKFTEPLLSRDHTERMLGGMGVNFQNLNSENSLQNSADSEIHAFKFTPLEKGKKLNAFKFEIPADPSSAFYFALAAAIVPDSEVLLENVLLNKTRIQAFRVLEKMGAKIKITPKNCEYEDIGDIYVKNAPLSAVSVDSKISWLIDEIPALAIAFACAKGKSVVRNAKELRVKESDRIKATLSGLKALGVECEEFEDGFSVMGGFSESSGKNGADLESKCALSESKGADSENSTFTESKSSKLPQINSFGDHRIAMSFAIAGLLRDLEILDSACMSVSFPNFPELLGQITKIQNF